VSEGLDESITAVMKQLSALSNAAKAVGDLPTMYLINQAWNRIHMAQEDRRRRRAQHA
jgi:hypothetical protein